VDKLNIAIVTGGSGCVGSAVCQNLGALDFIDRVLVLDLKEPEQNASGNIDFLKTDLSDEVFVESLIKHLDKIEGHVVTLVHCAAFYGDMPGWDCSFEHETKKAWEKVFAVNTFSLFLLVQALLGRQLDGQRLTLINISSYYGSRAPNPALYAGLAMTNVCSYGASKAASEQVVRWLSGMFGDRVRGNSIALGGVFRDQPGKFLDRYNASVPAGRMAVEDEVGNLAAFLADPRKSAYVSGQTIYLEGGKSIW
jgi:NAD(P)-dependent dehydrogenase (short-subunit alcohol dehydrogenase family)